VKRFSIVVIFSLILQGCGPLPMLWGAEAISPVLLETPITVFTAAQTETAAPTFTPTFTPTSTAVPTRTVVPTDFFSPTSEPPSAKIKRVIVITYDGLRADAVAEAPMPNLMSLMETGAYATARTINYAVTLPAHASLFSGTCQSKHGVDWDVTTYYKGYSQGVDVWDLAHAAGLKTVMIVNKEKLRQLAEPETTDVFQIVYGVESTIMKAAIDQIPAGFDLMFVHFGSGDARGHKYGWMSNAQFKAYRDGDTALGELLAALDESGLRDSTLILVTADHGGHERMHVGTVIEDLLIPWVANGPGIQPGQINAQVSIMDTAPTIAYALELPLQPEWDGFPVYEAFGLPQPNVHGDNICK
jgi:hypothetical protein